VGYGSAAELAPYYEGFDDPNLFSQGEWVSINYDAANTYDNNITWFTQTAAAFHTGTGSAMLNNYDAHANWDVDEIISPGINLSNLKDNQLNLSFYYSQATAVSSFTGLIDSFVVFASTDCGLNWTSIYTMGGAMEDNAGYVADRFFPTSANAYWQKANISLRPANNPNEFKKPDVIFKFQVFTSIGGNNLFIDDFNVGDVSTSINGLSAISSAAVFPNPTEGNSTLSLTLATPGKVSVKLFNMAGQEVAQVFDGSLNDGESRLGMTVSNLPPAVYIVNIQAGNSIMQKKLIVQ
jgi:hypothetical protein